MSDELTVHLPLVSRSAAAIRSAMETAYVEKPDAPQSQVLLGLVLESGEHLRAIESLLEKQHFSQTLIICRSCLEAMAVAYGIVSDEKLMKLLEKKSLEQFKKRLAEIGMLGSVTGLDETIRSIHPESTALLHVERLLDTYGKRLWRADKNLFYASYRDLCMFAHPDYLRLVEMVRVHDDGRGISLNPHSGAISQHLHFGVGIASAITTAMLAVFDEKTGIQFRPESSQELTSVLNLALDIFARRED